jgi:UDP-N-acetylglucosamine acyltransferase
MIHPTAIIHPQAKLDPTATVGPYAVIDGEVELGPHCSVGPHAYLTGRLTMGSHNQFFAGCVIGEAPQDLKYKGAPTRVRIGDHNVFREHVTVHRSTTVEGETVIGSHNFLMANAHVGHNSQVGDHVIMANGALLGGHVTVGDRAFISGNAVVHQFVRIGTLAILQGGTKTSKDVPPYTVTYEFNLIVGLNTIGLRRAGLTAAERLELKQLYRFLFRSGKNQRAAVAAAQKEFTGAPARHLLEFMAATKRGVCRDLSGKKSTEVEGEAEE